LPQARALTTKKDGASSFARDSRLAMFEQTKHATCHLRTADERAIF
jgi:hypothetical protein